MQSAYKDADKQRGRLEVTLERLGKRYDWGHITQDKYLAEYDEIQKQLRELTPAEDKVKNLYKFAHFLANVADAWREGNQEQRNKLAGALFEQVWIEHNRVVGIKPREELKPFFQLSYEEYLKSSTCQPEAPGVAI